MHYRRTLLAVVALPVVAGACRYFRPAPESPADTASEAAAAAAGLPAPTAADMAPKRTGPVNDRTISAMLLALNNTDISYAQLVPARAQRADVKEFAQRMLTDHTGVNALVREMLDKVDMAPEDNLASLDLRDESATRRDAMRDLDGFAFDSVYITNELSYHRKFLATLDDVMIPAARREQLRSLLGIVRPAVAAHLAHAEQVWANVMSKP